MTSDEKRDAIADALEAEVAPLREIPYGECGWFLRCQGVEGYEKETCSFGCVSEPACQTGQPSEGWTDPPSDMELLASVLMEAPVEVPGVGTIMVGQVMTERVYRNEETTNPPRWRQVEVSEPLFRQVKP